jgi:hypothetical protein
LLYEVVVSAAALTTSKEKLLQESVSGVAFNVLKGILLVVFAPLGQDRAGSALEALTQRELQEELVVPFVFGHYFAELIFCFAVVVVGGCWR